MDTNLPDIWSIEMNFVESKNILRRFGNWPDDLLTPDRLRALYSGQCRDVDKPFARQTGTISQPTFPFLDFAEESGIAEIWLHRRECLTAALRSGLASAVSPSNSTRDKSINPRLGWILAALQSLTILEMRAKEVGLRIWEQRTTGQKMGTLFAVSPTALAISCRVKVVPLAGGSVLCIPYGGPYSEYSKILNLSHNQYTQRVIESADKDLEVVPEGHVLKIMLSAGLLREHRQSLMDTRWVLSLSVVEWADARSTIPALSETARAISTIVAKDMPQIVRRLNLGKYTYLEGPGDYLEMAYQVLLGLLFQWGIEDGLFIPPPRYRVSGHGPVVELPRDGKQRASWTLPGVAIIRDATSVWNDLVTAAGG